MGKARLAFPRCAAGETIRAACVGLVDDLHERWELPSVYLLLDGRLRCQASRGYFQVSDGFQPSTGIIGRVVTTHQPLFVEDVRLDPTFIAAIPGIRSEACLPIWVDGEVVGALNVESRTGFDRAALAEPEAAARFLGTRLEALGGLPRPSLAERLARLAITLAGQKEARQVQVHAVAGVTAISGMSSGALACLEDGGSWTVAHATGPLADVFHSWDDNVLRILASWVWAGTSSYFPDGENVPPGYEFLGQGLHALSVQPLVVAGEVTGLLMTADADRVAYDPELSIATELLASQVAATLAMVRTLEHLEAQATQDPLTGLMNRRRLLDALQAAVERPVANEQRRGGRSGSALVLLDLDGFKAVNDHHGHAVGDSVLLGVARSLAACARQDDVVCRLGGDEFAVLVRDVDSAEDALAVAGRLVAAVAAPASGGWLPPVGASAGIRLVTGTSTSALLVDADVALYAAKRAGRGHTRLWDAEMRAEGLDQDALVADLRQALVDGGLSLVYQPVVDIRSLRVRGIEALARWQHPVRGAIAPTEFVACAERAGMVRDLTRWVLRTAFNEAASWSPAPDGEDINIAVNISAAQLADDLVVHDVREALQAAGLAADRVVLEVTETAQVVDLCSAKRTLDGLRALGLVLALDDFGTGYSSLTHVQALPFDVLKVDRSFVAAAALGEARALATIAAVCALAARIHVDVVAEGVEDQQQLAELTALGCNHAQGYALARPMQAADVAAALARRDPGGWVLARQGHAHATPLAVPEARRPSEAAWSS